MTNTEHPKDVPTAAHFDEANAPRDEEVAISDASGACAGGRREYGFIRPDGEFVLPRGFCEAEGFDGVAANVGLQPQGYRGLISWDGSYLLPVEASWINPRSESVYQVAYADQPAVTAPDDARWGLLSSDGSWLMKPQVPFVGPMREGRAAVQTAPGKWTWVTNTGELLTKKRFIWAGAFSEGRAMTFADNRFGYLDAAGEMVIPPQYLNVGDFRGGAAPVQGEDTKWRCIDRAGRLLCEHVFDGLYWFEYGFAGVMKGNRMGFVNTSGELPFGLAFDHVFNFNGDIAPVVIGGRANFINKEGIIFSETGWDAAYRPMEGMASYREGELFGYVNAAGEIVTPAMFLATNEFSEGFSACLFDGAWGYIDKTGAWVITPRFDEVRDFQQGYAPARVGDRWGYIDKTGAWAVTPRFSSAFVFCHGLAVVSG